MSRKKKRSAPPRNNETEQLQTEQLSVEAAQHSDPAEKKADGNDGEKASAAADYREIQKAWQEEHIRQIQAEREAEKKRAEEEEQKKRDAEEHERVTGLLEEANIQPEPLEMDIQISVGDLYRFNLYNTFHSSSGILALAGAAMVALVAFFTAGRIGTVYTVIYYICAAVFLLYYPLIGYLQARVQLERSMTLSHPLHYTFMDSGIDVLSNAVEEDNEEVLEWDDVLKAAETGSALYIYTGKTDGYILPKTAVSAKMPRIRKILRGGLPADALRLRGGRKVREADRERAESLKAEGN